MATLFPSVTHLVILHSVGRNSKDYSSASPAYSIDLGSNIIPTEDEMARNFDCEATYND
uniref:Uncharacterized protein n=1 Tax=Cyanothece sp. (strain PCC 7425 / ATCC 29141) TaxID=395961 RepID=B8HM83_CYAP4